MIRIVTTETPYKVGETVKLSGWVHKQRYLSKVTFLLLRDRGGIIQCILEKEWLNFRVENESIVEIIGDVVESKKQKLGVEIHVRNIRVINKCQKAIPFEINQSELKAGMDHLLNHRTISLRHEKNQAIFKIQSVLSQSFGDFFTSHGFTRIFTPKIVSQGAEGGANVFSLNYFGKNAHLAQSPQFYKQMMVASGFERVFEIGQVFRAEAHHSSRHLNEYVSLDVEIGFIDDVKEIMEWETDVLKYMISRVNDQCKRELEILDVKLPFITEIPCLTLYEAQEILSSQYQKASPEGDLDSEGERLIGEYVREKYNSEFVFITNYPCETRPMYTMPSNDSALTESYDLLYKGLEITSGGLRIHDYEMLLQSFSSKGLNPNNFASYIEMFQYGVPPHGGFAIGLERLTANMTGVGNIRGATAFPRDLERLIP
ncbi:aspartate--tRNA(Asn) ligase [Heyndrickxia oleronia]|jgi:nondiscriminating aspartyl-tRNA synthetase|uniref:aspartate--tRNA(Asn) ligase n=1 Tax=Heyndrickxia oleronia TaxID=38875 RepID=UPI00242D33AC|nr:aspartate--tRNA(Asn) ligase [Heyndrickxia oleronia]MCI1592064.1 aspartate--tRNA(Asn) ligase [Heyndrickxia oleronia]MCI1614381.1 aspartate--tRNA(Asn) ligase [Heyndrickxia oleronia]MCI1745508.1 aspartate--tRNA(Asn) ligase [Heyndrickxia oleronia]MCI1763749.1 aspartate--tRNA(Asn) ligase [Heyndrickxia oleronia]